MATIKLREKDMARMRKLNALNNYGLDSIMMNDLIDTHQRYKKHGFHTSCALIEFRLTDINFHREVEMLKDGKYEELKAQVAKW